MRFSRQVHWMGVDGPRVYPGDRCEDGRLLRHTPCHDDPYYEQDVGRCPDCGGIGCDVASSVPAGEEHTVDE